MVSLWVLIWTLGPALFWMMPRTTEPEIPQKPLVKQSEHQVYVNNICNTYRLLTASQPGKFVPEDLYEWIGIDKKIVEEYRTELKHKKMPLEVWIAVAPKIQQAVSIGYEVGSDKSEERQLVFDVATVLLDKKTRSVYDGTFLPIFKLPAAQRGSALRGRCKWEA